MVLLEKKTYLCRNLNDNNMNLRDIKKDIEYVLGAFVDDCATVVAVNPNVDEYKAAELIEEAIQVFNTLRDKVNVKTGTPKKEYFNALRKEILTSTDALYEKLSSVVKESVK